ADGAVMVREIATVATGSVASVVTRFLKSTYDPSQSGSRCDGPATAIATVSAVRRFTATSPLSPLVRSWFIAPRRGVVTTYSACGRARLQPTTLVSRLHGLVPSPAYRRCAASSRQIIARQSSQFDIPAPQPARRSLADPPTLVVRSI